MTVLYTDGPWEYVPTDPSEGWDGFRIVGEGKKNEWGDIASVTGPQQNPSSIADARLIAAAPALLEALKDLIDHAEQCMARLDHHDAEVMGEEPVNDARAAIQKATGKSV